MKLRTALTLPITLASLAYACLWWTAAPYVTSMVCIAERGVVEHDAYLAEKRGDWEEAAHLRFFLTHYARDVHAPCGVSEPPSSRMLLPVTALWVEVKKRELPELSQSQGLRFDAIAEERYHRAAELAWGRQEDQKGATGD